MELNVSLYRYNPEQDKFPYMKNYKVKKPEKDIMVLDPVSYTHLTLPTSYAV